MSGLTCWPMPMLYAKRYIEQNHRHHKAPIAAFFSLAASVDGELVGVIIVGKPKARMIDDGLTAEVLRCCTDGYRNACSFLYGAAWKGARSLGYRRLITYTLPEEGGASLRASGWREDGPAGGGKWKRVQREGWAKRGTAVDEHPLTVKTRWSVSTHDYELALAQFEVRKFKPEEVGVGGLIPGQRRLPQKAAQLRLFNPAAALDVADLDGVG